MPSRSCKARSAGPDSAAGARREAGLNENLAREMMELHTVGADGGYGQADVTELARALTGWSVPTARDARTGRRGERAATAEGDGKVIATSASHAGISAIPRR